MKKRLLLFINKHYSRVNELSQKNELTRLLFISLFLIPIYLLIYKVYISHTNSFGCFDECMNFGGAYFMQWGKRLYSEIFFNHQPMMAYLSYIVQVTTQPQNLYEFLLRHMQFTILFSFLFNFFLIRRFGLPAIGFIIFYELSKFYIFGYRFLAESLIVYPMVYMAGLIWYKLQKKKIYDFEYILAGIFTWFVLFSREPYTFVALFAYFFILGFPDKFSKKISLAVALLLSIIVLASVPLSDYLFSVGKVSYQAVLQGEAKSYSFAGQGLLKVFFYPFFTFFGGKWNEFRVLLVGISALLIFFSYYLAWIRKQWFALGVIIVLLGLANIRVVDPGTTHYEAFHMIVWYGMSLMILFLMIREYVKKQEIRALVACGVLAVVFIVYLLYPNNFLRSRTDRHEELITNYGQTILIGEVVKSLSEKDDTFFIDYIDNLNLAYWQSQRISPYRYSWYAYVASAFPEYTNARKEMFLKNPPDFYYGELPSAIKNAKLPEKIISEYYQLSSAGEKSKLYLRKSMYERIPNEKWEIAKKWGFEKPVLK